LWEASKGLLLRVQQKGEEMTFITVLMASRAMGDKRPPCYTACARTNHTPSLIIIPHAVPPDFPERVKQLAETRRTSLGIIASFASGERNNNLMPSRDRKILFTVHGS